MKISCLYSILFLLPLFSQAQKFTNAGIPNPVFSVRDLCVDTLNNKLYSVGYQTLDGSMDPERITVYSYDGVLWASLDTVSDQTYSCAVYNGEVYIAGGCKGITYSNYLSKWNGSEWEHFGDSISARIITLKVISNDLYAMGFFEHIGGIDATGIAKWDGTSWSAIYNCPYTQIGDCAFYNGDFYVGGNFTDASGFVDLAVNKAGAWQPVGSMTDRLRGGLGNVWSLQVYKGELYVGGNISKGEGNIGHGIQKWNGSVWSEVGSGLQDINNMTAGWTNAQEMMVFDGKLFVSGQFFYAGNIFSRGLASWDGNYWCSVDTTFKTQSTDIAFFNDTLFAMTANDTVNGIYTNNLVKFDNYDPQSCSIGFSIEENQINNALSVYPNPGSGIFTIDFDLFAKESKIMVLNPLGESVLQKSIESETDLQVNLTGQPPGVYFLSLFTAKDRYSAKIILY